MTRLMVLGLLRNKPMSGYEIQQLLQISEVDRWAGILPGSIYHALKKMEKENLVEIETLEQTGNRTKAIYKITEKGQEEFLILLKESLELPSAVLPTAFYTGLSFIRDLPVDDVLEALHKQKEVLEKELELHKGGVETKRKYMPIDEIMELNFQNIFDQFEMQINFINSLIDIFNRKNNV